MLVQTQWRKYFLSSVSILFEDTNPFVWWTLKSLHVGILTDGYSANLLSIWLAILTIRTKLFCCDQKNNKINSIIEPGKTKSHEWCFSVFMRCNFTTWEYEVHTISFQTFFVWALLLMVHTWNSRLLRSNLLRMQCTCTVPKTSGRPHGSPLVWACQWPSSQPLSSPQLSHNDSLWA